MERLHVWPGLRMKRAVGLLDLHGREIVNELLNGVGRGYAVALLYRFRDCLAGTIPRQQVDSEAVLQVCGYLLNVRIQWSEVVLAQSKQHPASGILQHVAELREELAFCAKREGIGSEDLLKLIK